MLSPKSKLDNEIAVTELLEELGIVEYPLDVFLVARRLGIRLVPYSTLGPQIRSLALVCSQDAFTVISKGVSPNSVIAFNDVAYLDCTGRGRFSLAHEIGHIWLEHSPSSPNREDEANYFAGYILAPHPLILTYHLDPQMVSDFFDVSSSCANLACAQATRRSRVPGTLQPHESWLLRSITRIGGGRCIRVAS